LAVSHLKPPFGGFINGRFRSETAIWIQKWFKNPFGLLESSRYNNFQGGDDKRGYINMCKVAGGSKPNLSNWRAVRCGTTQDTGTEHYKAPQTAAPQGSSVSPLNRKRKVRKTRRRRRTAELSPRPVGIRRKKVAILPGPCFRGRGTVACSLFKAKVLIHLAPSTAHCAFP
jgi:hypothetical protein